MKAWRKSGSDEEGSGIVAVMIVILISASLVGTVLLAASRSAFLARKLAERARAQAIAEAGADAAYSVLRTNFGARSNEDAFPYTEYGGGYYDVEVLPISNNLAIITSTGFCGSSEVAVMVDIKNYGGAYDGEDSNVWNYAAASGAGMNWSGSGDMTVTGGVSIHANGPVEMNGGGDVVGDIESAIGISSVGNGEIIGDATAPSYDGKMPANIDGIVVTGEVPIITIPKIDLTPYYNVALANGQVYDGTESFWNDDTTIIPEGGILWVNGDVKIAGQLNVIGSIIATGDITITGNGDFTKTNMYPLLVSRDGDIDIAGGGAFSGLIYTRSGDFEKTGNGGVTGQIIVAGEFDKGGGWSMLCYSNCMPIPPVEGSTNDIIGVSAWQQ